MRLVDSAPLPTPRCVRWIDFRENFTLKETTKTSGKHAFHLPIHAVYVGVYMVLYVFIQVWTMFMNKCFHFGFSTMCVKPPQGSSMAAWHMPPKPHGTILKPNLSFNCRCFRKSHTDHTHSHIPSYTNGTRM